MAIAFRNEAHITPGTGTSVTITEPTGTTSGDFLLVLYVIDSPGGPTPTAPSGWTVINSGVAESPTFRYSFAYIIRGASPPADLTFVHTGSLYREAFCVCFSGVDTTTPIDATGTEVKPAISASPADPPSATATASDDMAIAAHIMWASSAAGGWTAPTGYTLRTSSVVGAGAMASKQLVSSGAENPGPFSNASGAADLSWAQTVLLKASTGGGGVGTPAPIQIIRSNIRLGP